jgi:large subunit ribosomal protein L2
MSFRVLNPTNPGSRNTILVSFRDITCQNPEKRLLNRRVNTVGGRIGIVSNHRIVGRSRLYRQIDFKRKKIYEIGKVHSIEYDPNRNSRVALIHYKDGKKTYILAPKCIIVGMEIISGFRVAIKNGNALPLWNIALGINVHNVEFRPRNGGKLRRSRGTYANLVSRIPGYVILRIPSGVIRLIPHLCWATIGNVGCREIKNINKGKAGRTRWSGWRPTVRGSAMNPIDHPHGGGEGRSPIGRIAPFTPWSKPRLGGKTIKRKNYMVAFFVRS